MEDHHRQEEPNQNQPQHPHHENNHAPPQLAAAAQAAQREADNAIVLAAVAQEAVNQMLVPVSCSSGHSSSSNSLDNVSAVSNDVAVATAAAAAAIALSASAVGSGAGTTVRANANGGGGGNNSKHGSGLLNGEVKEKKSVPSVAVKKRVPQSISLLGIKSKEKYLASSVSSSTAVKTSNSYVPVKSLPPENTNANTSSSARSSTVSSAAGKIGNPATSNLRRGKWTLEEEAYVARVIRDFNSGYLAAPAGTTLRTYLSEKLHCDPMRITKKFTGDACIGKRVFHPAVRTAANASVIDKAQAELKLLEAKWRERLELQQREASKKAGRHHSLHHMNSPALSSAGANNDVTRTAVWLDKVDMILQNASVDAESASGIKQGETNRIPHFTLEEQMENVQRLIHEGPLIQQKSSKLIMKQRLDVERHGEALSKRKVSECAGGDNGKTKRNDKEVAGAGRQDARTDDSIEIKKARKPTSGTCLSSFEHNASDSDAEALVGFLNAVRKERQWG